MATVSSGGGDPPCTSSGVVSSGAIGVCAAPRFRGGLRLAALAGVADGSRVAPVRRYALADLRFCVVPDAPEPTTNDPSYASARIHIAWRLRLPRVDVPKSPRREGSDSAVGRRASPKNCLLAYAKTDMVAVRGSICLIIPRRSRSRLQQQ